MPKAPHVRLAIMSNAPSEMLLRAVQSARPLIDSACILINPKAYDRLPADGFGFMCLETKVVQLQWRGVHEMRTELLHRAEADTFVDWVLMIDADEIIAEGAKLPMFSDKVDAYMTPYMIGEVRRQVRFGHLMRARCGFKWTRHGMMFARGDRSARHDELVVTKAGPIVAR